MRISDFNALRQKKRKLPVLLFIISRQPAVAKIVLLLTALLSSALSIAAAEPLIVAHRGASKDAPENTIPAFELAWEQGADAIEGDFHQTKDGFIICIHDKDTKKVAGEKWVVKRTMLNDLRRLDVGKYHNLKYKGTIAPTIAEVFDTVPQGKKIYVEIKSNRSIVPVLLREIEKSGLSREQIVVISFNEKVIKALKAKAPQYKAMWLQSIKKDGTGKVRPSVDLILETLAKCGADGFSSGKDNITKSMIDRVLEEGYEYHVWTVDDAEVARKFRDWGALSITTNVPGYIREALERE